MYLTCHTVVYSTISPQCRPLAYYRSERLENTKQTIACCPHFAGINMNSVHFTTSLSMSKHLGGMPTVGSWGKKLQKQNTN